eukprot:100278-Hanusia_phi.AAC.1
MGILGMGIGRMGMLQFIQVERIVGPAGGTGFRKGVKVHDSLSEILLSEGTCSEAESSRSCTHPTHTHHHLITSPSKYLKTELGPHTLHRHDSISNRLFAILSDQGLSKSWSRPTGRPAPFPPVSAMYPTLDKPS